MNSKTEHSKARAQLRALVLAVALGALPIVVSASPVRDFAGVVDAVTKNTIVLHQGDQVLELQKKDIGGASLVNPGDFVSGTYRMQIQEIQIRKRGQSPGSVATPAPTHRVPKELMKDDRAFYNARNDHPSPRPSRGKNG